MAPLGRAWPLLLPLAYLLHLAEEWWGGEGFAAWTARALELPVSEARFLVLNGVVWPLFTVLSVMAVRRAGWAWFPTAFGSLVLVNAAMHAVSSVTTSSYSPGLVTGVLLYLPLGSYAVADGRRRLSRDQFAAAVVAGVVAHVIVGFIAFS